MAESKKIQKRAFYEVKAPLTASKIHLYGTSPAALEGKIVTLDLTRSLRGKSLILKLRVKALGEQLEADPISLELAGSYVRRAIRKGTDYVEDSFETACKDEKVVVKPFLLTRKKVSRALRHALRNGAKEHLEAYLKIHTAKEVFTDIMTNKVQKELSLKLKKIYPLALCEIRVFSIIVPPTMPAA